MLKKISSFFCNHKNPSFVEERTSSDVAFIETFQRNAKILSAEIYGYKLRLDSFKTFVVYKIRVKTTELEFRVEKRFKEFFELKEKLENCLPEGKSYPFPEKKLIGNLSQNNITARRSKLADFLKEVMKLENEAKVGKLLIDFFDVSRVFKENNITIKHQNLDVHNIAFTLDDKRLIDMLYLLNKHSENMISSFKAIQTFFEEGPHVSKPVINVLLKGYGGLNGLVHLANSLNHDNSHIHLACCACLKLICFLLDFESNPNAEICHEVFASLSSREFAHLSLASHITETPGNQCKKSSLKLVDIYKASNPNANSFLFSQMLDSDEACDIYKKWKSSMTIVSQKTESFSMEQSNEMSAETRIESMKLFRTASNVSSESRPKSGLYKRRIKI